MTRKDEEVFYENTRDTAEGFMHAAHTASPVGLAASHHLLEVYDVWVATLL